MLCYVIVLLLGALAGGHFNPATSIGVYASGGSKSLACLVSVLISQVAGAIGGLTMALITLGEREAETKDWFLPEHKVPEIASNSALMSMNPKNPLHHAHLILPINVTITFVMIATILILINRLPCE